MRIGILTDWVDASKTGVGVVTYNLIKALTLIDNENEYYLIYNQKRDIDIYRLNRGILIPRVKPFGSFVWRNAVLPVTLQRKQLDLVHDPGGIGPLMFHMPFKKVITFHDLGALYCPESFRTGFALLHRLLLYPAAARNADKIITGSEFSKRDLIKHLKVPEGKIEVIHHGLDKRYKPLSQEEITEVKRKYNLDFPFILYVGIIGTKKNILNLIEAYHRVRDSLKRYRLVIVGRRARTHAEIFRKVEMLGLQNDVLFTGYVPDDDLPGIYNAADLFAFPSLYEGFGIPVLEAMACGTPVVASNASSLPEVTGDAAIMVDPYDVHGLAGAMHELVTNKSLREKMVQRGLERAKLFTWEKAARETLRVYREVASGG